MSANRKPTNVSHLRRLIDEWGRDATVSLSAKRITRLVAVTALTQMLDGLGDGDTPRVAFKGGASQELRFGVRARTSRDVDALTDGDFDDAFSAIAERLVAGWSGFTGKLTERTPITRAGIVPLPQRCKIKLAYMGKAFATLDFELGREDRLFEIVEIVPSALDIERVRIRPERPVSLLNVHYQIAQKVHACTEVPADGENERVHDIYDVLLLVELLDVSDLGETRVACERTFEERARHRWPPTVPIWPAWPELWDRLDIEETARISYGDALEAFVRLIARIAAAD